MALIDIKIDPTPRDLKIFAVLWAAFFLILGKIAFFTDAVIFSAAVFTSSCFLISFAFNRDYAKKLQLWGLLFPSGLWGLYFLERWALHTDASSAAGWLSSPRTYLGITAAGAQWLVLAFVVTLGVLGTLLMLTVRGCSRIIYRTWMFAALPIGWTVSHLVLGLVYFLILTPIGLALRLLGKDPMTSTFDKAAGTYWTTAKTSTDPQRAFRQF